MPKTKGRLARLRDATEDQVGHHKTATLALVIFLLGVLVGGRYIISPYVNTVSNPTASQTTYTQKWTLSDGTVFNSGDKISGVISCSIQPSQSAVVEVSTWTAFGQTYSVATPYYIMSVVLDIYSGSSASGTPLSATNLAVSDGAYLSAMQAWVMAFSNTIMSHATQPSLWLPGPTPSNNPVWTLSIDTRLLSNGVYTFQVVATWGIGFPTSSAIVIPPPPSLGSGSGGNMFLDSLVLGNGVFPDMGGDLTWVYASSGAVALIVIAVLIMRHRKNVNIKPRRL